MKVANLTGIRGIEIQDAPDPRIVSPRDVLIDMKRVGVCGSDIHYYTDGAIGSQIVQYPWTAGHEGAGVVAEIGRDVTGLKVGDRVAFDPCISCGKCDQCVRGRRHTCRHQTFLGCPGQSPGCLANWVVLPADCCYIVPDSLTFDDAALVEPLSIAVHAVKLAGSLAGLSVGILGAGPIGLCTLAVARVDGPARVFVTDKIDRRVDAACQGGADWAGNPDKIDVVTSIAELCPLGLDVVFECTGDQAAIDQAVTLLAPGGKLMLVGIPGGHNRISMEINQLRRKEICVQNVRRQNECVDHAIDLIASGMVDIRYLLTHHFPFSHTRDAFELVAAYGDGVLKAMIELG